MRIPFPERFPINRVAIFAAVLFLIQMLEGTALYFSMGCVVFILVAAFAFNAAGGLTRASGAYIFAYCMLDVIIGLCYKAYLGEPAQSNLSDPRTDIEAYVGSIAAMYAAVVLSRRVTRKIGLLQNLLGHANMHRASIGCILFSVVGGFVLGVLGESVEGLRSAFAQLNQLIPLGIIIGVMYEIRRSGGTRCSNLTITAAAVYSFFLGATGFSKEGMIEPFFCWLLPISALRYRLSIVQVLGCALGVFIVFYWVVPFSQYGRSQVPENPTVAQRIEVATTLLEHPNQTRQSYLEGQEKMVYQGAGTSGFYYGKPQGFWDRLQFVSVDDTIINLTDEGRVVGFAPIAESFWNVVPRFIWPNKPRLKFGGNYYARELGQLAPDDTTTGIAFSPTGEAYHIARWGGIFLLAPLLWFMLFTMFDFLLGDIRSSAWGLLSLGMMSHSGPEGGITIIPYLCSFGIEILIFCAFFATWFAPLFATFVLGPERRGISGPLSFASTFPHTTRIKNE